MSATIDFWFDSHPRARTLMLTCGMAALEKHPIISSDREVRQARGMRTAVGLHADSWEVSSYDGQMPGVRQRLW